MLLYDRAQLDGDNSELDALKRLALSHDSNEASLEETSPLPTLPFVAPLYSKKHSTKNVAAAVPSAERRVKVESASLEHPVSAKSTKLLVIPGSLSSAMRRHSVTTESHSSFQGGRTHEVVVSGRGTPGPMKRRIQSDYGPKSVPLGDVMNVQAASARDVQRGRISLVPLSSAVSSPVCSTVTSDWNQQVRIKLEPELSCSRAGKRKLPVVAGMFLCIHFLLECPPSLK